jgi:hypothetical protein
MNINFISNQSNKQKIQKYLENSRNIYDLNTSKEKGNNIVNDKGTISTSSKIPPNLTSKIKEKLSLIKNSENNSENSCASNKQICNVENYNFHLKHNHNHSDVDIDDIIQKFLQKQENQCDSPLTKNQTNDASTPYSLTKILEKKKLENITKKAAEYVDQCKKTNEDFNILIEEYNRKKEKIKTFAKNLNTFHKELKHKEEKILRKEKDLNKIEAELIQQKNTLTENKKKFENFVDLKSKELEQKAEEINQSLEILQNSDKVYMYKTDEIENRLEYANKIEDELKKLFNQYQYDKSQFETEKMEFEYKKNEFEIYSQEVIKKYNETKTSQEEINKKQAHFEILQSEVNSKEQNVKLLLKKYEEENKIFLIKKEELEKKISQVMETESNLNKLKIETEDKLKELSTELEETKRLNKNLRDKEIVFKIKHNIEKDLDLKLSEIELNENLSKKKMAIQEKLLNEEIMRKLNNTLISQSKFYK